MSEQAIMPVPQYQQRPWGGNAFHTLFGRKVEMRTGEAWELSVHPHGLSCDASGHVLRDLYPDLSLIFKLLDAHEVLSVQVHPATGAEAKTEMWIVLHAEPGAYLYAGLRAGETRESVRSHINDGTMEQAMERHVVQVGDCIFLPGGTVHALGAGIVVAEIQQPGDTTYRLYDWGRPRELHIEQGLEAIRFESIPALNHISKTDALSVLAECPYFTAKSFRGIYCEGNTQEHHTVIFTLSPLNVRTEHDMLPMEAWQTLLLPRGLGKYVLETSTHGEALIFEQNSGENIGEL